MRKRHFKIKPVGVIALGFLIAIFIGTIFLMLPISSQNKEDTNLFDALFTATSAVSVTGLTTLDTGEYWSSFGKAIILILIQLGGIGFMSFTVLYALITRKKLSLNRRIIMREALSIDKFSGIFKLVQHILLFTFIVEFIGALILMVEFIPLLGIKKGIYFSVFHSISSFCNGGFDLFGNSLEDFRASSIVLITVALLTIAGALGFSVWLDLFSYKKTKKLSLNTKLILVVSGILTLGGMVLVFIFEYNNPLTMKDFSLKYKLLNSFFASVAPRSVGFNSISFFEMTKASRFLTIILIFIGGSPGSTAGGVKTTTIGVLALTVISVFKGREDTEFMKKRISKDDVYKAFVVVFISGVASIIGIFLLSISDGNNIVNGRGLSLENVMYEVISAIATAGIDLGMPSGLSNFGKIIVVFLMYIGRIGSLTFVFALMKKADRNKGIKYPEEKIMIG